jgi:hypothetical protein
MFRGHQPGAVTKRLRPAAQVMCADTRFVPIRHGGIAASCACLDTSAAARSRRSAEADDVQE